MTPGGREGQVSLMCSSQWGIKEFNTAEQQQWTSFRYISSATWNVTHI